MNHDGNQAATADGDDLTIVVERHAAAVRELWRGSLGRTVRCVPSRRTLMAADGGSCLYAKRYRAAGGADAEWRWLHRLRQAGEVAAEPVARVRSRRGSMVVFGAVPGRSLDAWAVTAADEGWLDRWFAYCVREVASLARRLHDRRWIHRDLNLAHLFARDPREGGRPAVIDVERMFRPRWRWRRWVVKELASLLASSPVPVPVSIRARFLRGYAGGLSVGERRALFAAVARKVARIEGHRPRFG